jgi:hypothetical protein
MIPIALATFGGHIPELSAYREAGAHPKLEEHPAPLIIAASKEYVKIVRTLIDARVDVIAVEVIITRIFPTMRGI